MAADEIQIHWQRAARRIEETLVHGVRIGAPDESQRGDVVRGDHTGITRMELAGPSAARQLGGDLVDALGHDERWSVDGFCQKVSHRAVETSRQEDPLPILCHKSKGAFNAKNRSDVISEQAASSLRLVN